MKDIFPRSLVVAAKSFTNKPQIVGQVLIALCTGKGEEKLTEVQKYILASCVDELTERENKRAADAARKRKAK